MSASEKSPQLVAQSTTPAAVSVPRQIRWTKAKRTAAAAGMLVMRAEEYDDGRLMSFERKGADVIMRVRVKNIGAEAWQGIKSAFENGRSPFMLLDKSGLVVKMRDTVLSGQPIARHNSGKILESLPRGAELPDGMRWGDFTDRQLIALVMLTDVMSDNTRGTIANIVGVEQETLDAWEGNANFLKVKKFLLERKTHVLREKYMRNVTQGMDSDDEQARVQWTKIAGERLGYTAGARKQQQRKETKDPALLDDVARELEEMTPEHRLELAKALKDTADIYRASVVTPEGELVAKSQPEKGDA